MKTQRFSKIAAIALAMLLLVGAVVGITVAAEDTGATSLTVAGKNLAYEGALQVVYYVDAPNYNAENQTLKMNFWVGAIGNAPSYTKEFNENDVMTVGGKTYYCFFSNGIAPVDMTKPIYAQAFIENADGTTVTEGEIAEYSVYTYAMNRFSQSPTEDQLTLYKALLDYGAAVQDVLGDPADVEKYGWADAYYAVTANVYINGEKTENTISTVGKRAMDVVDANGVYKLSGYADSYNGAMYLKMTKEGDSEVASNIVTPGCHAYDIYYTNKGTFQDFENLTDVNNLFEGGSPKQYYQYVSVNLNSSYDESVTDKGYLNVSDIADRNGNTNKALTFGVVANATTAPYWMFDINDGIGLTANEVGHTYIVDYDFKIISSGKQTSENEILRMTFTKDKSNITNGSGIFLHDQTHLYYGSDYYRIGHKADIWISTETWYDIRYEYTITSESTSQLTVYVNGEQEYTVALNTVLAPEAFYFQMQQCASKQEYVIDNLWYYDYNEAESLIAGQGKYYSESIASNKTGATVFDFEDKSVVTPNVSSGGSVFTVSNGVASCVTNETYSYFVIDSNNVTTADNEKFIVEFDYMVKASGVTSDIRAQYIKLYSGSSYLGAISIYASKNGFKVGSTSNPTLPLNEWYNIRIEITDDVGKYYVNNIELGDFSFQTGKSTTGYSNKIRVWYENCNSTSGYSYVIDNLVFDNVDTNNFDYYDKYQAGVLTNAELVDMTGKTSVGQVLTNPGSNLQTQNSRPTTGSNSYALIEDGVLSFGTLEWYSLINMEKPQTDLTVGTKYVVEFDYRFNHRGEFTTGTKYGSMLGRLALLNSGKGNVAYVDVYYNSSSAEKYQLCFANDGNTFKYLNAGEWHRICMELEVTETGTTVTYKLDGSVVTTKMTSESAASMLGLQGIVYGTAAQEHSFDNFVFAVIPAAE